MLKSQKLSLKYTYKKTYITYKNLLFFKDLNYSSVICSKAF